MLKVIEISKLAKEFVPGLANYKIERIARTESSKAATALTQVRCETVGIKWYKWSTSEDARVRSSHRHMDNVLIRWDNPPSPEQLIGEKSQGFYNAGEIYNCRCVCLPIVNLNQVKFHAKIYINGQIQRISKKNFERLI